MVNDSRGHAAGDRGPHRVHDLGGGVAGAGPGDHQAAGAGGEGGRITFEKSDKEVEADGETTILDAGEDAGVVMPSGCRMGICFGCVLPLRDGQVRDLRTGAVHGEPGDLIQTCISGASGAACLDTPTDS